MMPQPFSTSGGGQSQEVDDDDDDDEEDRQRRRRTRSRDAPVAESREGDGQQAPDPQPQERDESEEDTDEEPDDEEPDPEPQDTEAETSAIGRTLTGLGFQQGADGEVRAPDSPDRPTRRQQQARDEFRSAAAGIGISERADGTLRGPDSPDRPTKQQQEAEEERRRAVEGITAAPVPDASLAEVQQDVASDDDDIDASDVRVVETDSGEFRAVVEEDDEDEDVLRGLGDDFREGVSEPFGERVGELGPFVGADAVLGDATGVDFRRIGEGLGTGAAEIANIPAWAASGRDFAGGVTSDFGDVMGVQTVDVGPGFAPVAGFVASGDLEGTAEDREEQVGEAVDAFQEQAEADPEGTAGEFVGMGLAGVGVARVAPAAVGRARMSASDFAADQRGMAGGGRRRRRQDTEIEGEEVELTRFADETEAQQMQARDRSSFEFMEEGGIVQVQRSGTTTQRRQRQTVDDQEITETQISQIESAVDDIEIGATTQTRRRVDDQEVTAQQLQQVEDAVTAMDASAAQRISATQTAATAAAPGLGQLAVSAMATDAEQDVSTVTVADTGMQDTTTIADQGAVQTTVADVDVSAMTDVAVGTQTMQDVTVGVGVTGMDMGAATATGTTTMTETMTGASQMTRMVPPGGFQTFRRPRFDRSGVDSGLDRRRGGRDAFDIEFELDFDPLTGEGL